MKRQYLLLAAISCAISSIQAQTLTASGINGVAGENYNTTNSGAFSEGNAGTGQTWDISSASGTASYTNVVAASSTPAGASFPGATIAYAQPGVYTYLNTSSTAMQNVGIAAGTINIVYSNPEDLLHFPFAMGNTYTDSWAAQFNSGGTTFHRSGTTTVTADGVGTLITPAGTYTNVVRVHFVQDYQDSTNFGGVPYIITYDNDQYFWYKDGTHYTLASTYELTTSTGGPQSGGYFQSPYTGIAENDLAANMLVYPNPASDNVQVRFTTLEATSAQIAVVNLAGQVVLSAELGNIASGEHTQALTTTGISAGTYLVRITTNEGTATQRLVIQ